MTQLETGAKRFRGYSTEEKPGIRADISTGIEIDGTPPVGSVFTEIDTGKRFVWSESGSWVRQEQTVEELLAQQIALMEQILARLDATHRGHEEYGWGEEVETE